MHTVRMPVVDDDTSIDDALASMRKADRSAVVSRQERRFWIIKAGQLIKARERGRRKIAAVKERDPVRRLVEKDIAEYRLNIVDPKDSAKRYRDLFEHVRTNFIIFGLADDFATIVTRSEDYGAQLETPSDCYCTGKRQHSIPPNTQTGGKCDVCSKPVVCD